LDDLFKVRDEIVAKNDVVLKSTASATATTKAKTKEKDNKTMKKRQHNNQL